MTEKTKAQIFKEMYGYSLTTFRLMNKKEVDFEGYKALRKNWKKEKKLKARLKRETKKALRKKTVINTLKKKK